MENINKTNEKYLFDTSLNDVNLGIQTHILSILKKYLIVQNSTALEIGVGNGRFVNLLGNKFKKYSGIDPREEFVNEAKQFHNANIKIGTAEKVPFDEQFDVILFTNSFHHAEYDKAISETKRLLKKDGLLVVVEPCDKTIFDVAKFTPNHPEFDEQEYNQKIAWFKEAENYLKNLTEFIVLHESIGPAKGYRYLILRHK